MDRRRALKWSAALAASLHAAARVDAAAPALRQTDTDERFDYAALKGRARALAAAPYQPVARRVPAEVAALDYDRYQAIRSEPRHALWAGERRGFRASFFHLGLTFQQPVRIFELAEGRAKEIAYDPGLFDYGKSGLHSERLPKDLGFAGFRLARDNDPLHDIVAFLGTSYFRAVGAELQYGLSARGLAVDTGMEKPEEFPLFSHFWLERPAANATRITVYALLDSPSIAGAYRFEFIPGPVLVMEVDASLYPRTPIQRLGIAPLTSMFYYGENDRRRADDWRPEIHDSDGLALWTGTGEWIWRPLVNPAALRFNAYRDRHPKGFGLLQRDRDFDHYQDDGVFYDRRPSLWVEPRGQWGEGSVQLVEIPTRDETFDNIVAFWHPAREPAPGEELLFSYRLHWGSRMPFAPSLARVVATRTGMGGPPGQERKVFSWRFAVDFSGGDLARLPRGTKVEPVITVSHGSIREPAARPLAAVSGYRAMFDVAPSDSSTAPVDIRLYLRAGNRPLSETWLYQWSPPADRSLYPGL